MTEQTEQSREAVKKVWDNDFFIMFMGKRFPEAIYSDYIEEWKWRIQSFNFMPLDTKGRKAYKDTVDYFLNQAEGRNLF